MFLGKCFLFVFKCVFVFVFFVCFKMCFVFLGLCFYVFFVFLGLCFLYFSNVCLCFWCFKYVFVFLCVFCVLKCVSMFVFFVCFQMYFFVCVFCVFQNVFPQVYVKNKNTYFPKAIVNLKRNSKNESSISSIFLKASSEVTGSLFWEGRGCHRPFTNNNSARGNDIG